MTEFAQWLSATSPSVFLQTNYNWAIPALQSIHIMAIAMVFGSVLMLELRVFGFAGTDQTLRQTTDRFGPWLTGSLWVLLATGALLVVGEPTRELLTFSFWSKMVMILIGVSLAIAFRLSLRRREAQWETELIHSGSVRALAVVTFAVWIAIIFLGRLIAYDHLWGSWSPGNRGG